MIDTVDGGTATLATWLLLPAAATAAWVASGFRPFTWPAALAASASALVVFVRAARTRHPRQERLGLRGRWSSAGVVGWVLVIALLCGWELFQYASHPRSLHPTISSMEGVLLAAHWRRAGLYLLWLLAGWDLAGR